MPPMSNRGHTPDDASEMRPRKDAVRTRVGIVELTGENTRNITTTHH